MWSQDMSALFAAFAAAGGVLFKEQGTRALDSGLGIIVICPYNVKTCQKKTTFGIFYFKRWMAKKGPCSFVYNNIICIYIYIYV